jgi:hypothetical protein
MATSRHSAHNVDSGAHCSTDDDLRSATSNKLPYHATFPFFDLPPEIRDRVYSLAFPIQYLRRSRHPYYCCDDMRRYKYYLPDFMLGAYQWEDSLDKTSSHLFRIQFQMWLPVNQQFLVETIEVFVRGKVFDITSYDDVGGCPKDRNFWLGGSSAAEKSVAVYRDLFLVRAVQSIKAPRIQNRWSPTALKFSSKRDEEAMLTFSKLRGADALPPNLELEWTYYLDCPKKSDKSPTSSSPTLGAWRNMFARVAITVTIQDSHSFRSTSCGTLTASSVEDLRSIYSEVQQQAAAWARLLVKKSNEVEQHLGVSKETVKPHWTFTRTSSQTMEVVDSSTKPVRPLKTLHYE